MEQAFEAAQIIASLFPSLSPTDINNLLLNHKKDIDAALEGLYSYQHTQLCRHYLQGSCYRADCWYSHDTNQICKFWLQGSCLKPNCPFAHCIHLLPGIVDSEPEKVQEIIQERIDFPVLGRPSSSEFFGVSYNKVVAKTPTEQSLPKPVTPRLYEPGKQRVEMNWLKTGDDVSFAYSKHREEAIQVALDRNRFFQRATEAYLNGNKAAARGFSRQGRELNERLKELQMEAASGIFAERNPHYKPPVAKPMVPTSFQKETIDVHGLYPQEAIVLVDQHLTQLKNARFHGELLIVTGTGHHSRLGYSKLYPAIKDYLESKRYRFKEGTLQDNKGGILTVAL